MFFLDTRYQEMHIAISLIFSQTLGRLEVSMLQKPVSYAFVESVRKNSSVIDQITISHVGHFQLAYLHI